MYQFGNKVGLTYILVFSQLMCHFCSHLLPKQHSAVPSCEEVSLRYSDVAILCDWGLLSTQAIYQPDEPSCTRLPFLSCLTFRLVP